MKTLPWTDSTVFAATVNVLFCISIKFQTEPSTVIVVVTLEARLFLTSTENSFSSPGNIVAVKRVEETSTGTPPPVPGGPTGGGVGVGGGVGGVVATGQSDGHL